jgi:hypothetical protein
LFRHDRNTAWRQADLRRFIEEGGPMADDDFEERAARGTAWLETPADRGEGNGPTGYEHGVDVYDLNRYALGHGPPLAENWFSGPRDRRFAFDAGGTSFGLVSGKLTRD